MRTTNSSTGPTTRSLKLREAKMKKVQQLEYLVTIVVETNNGKLFTLMKLTRIERRVLMTNSVSISTDHFTSDQDCQCKESLNAMVPTMSGSRDGERTLEPKNGSSMESQRPSRTTTGSHTHLIFNPTVDQPMSDALLPTQDGGKSGDLKVVSLSTRKVRFLKFKTKTLTLTPRTETSR
jgi:hypothetical protein